MGEETREKLLDTNVRNSSCQSRFRGCVHDNLMLILLILGVCAGVCLGICLRLFVPAFQQPDLNPREMMYLFLPAEILLRIMTLISLPLVVSSLISAIGTLDAKVSGKIGLFVLCYYVGTTCIAVMEGFAFVYAIKPGRNMDQDNLTQTDTTVTIGNSNRVDALIDMIRNVFPDNLIKAAFNLYSTHITYTNYSSPHSNLSEVIVEQFENKPVDAMNILGITVTSLVFGIALTTIGVKGRLLFHVFDALFDTTMEIVKVVFWLYPVGIVFMTATTVVELKNPLQLFQSLSVFILTVLLGLCTHFFIVQPILLFIITRKNPYKHMARCAKALLTAFATSNSNVTVPVTMDCLVNAGYSDKIIRFMIPIGATVNMDGFALYEATAAIFIALLNGMNPGIVQVLTLGITAVAISIGAPTTGSGIVVYVILFKSIGLPLKDISLLLPFDWILGKLRTSTNVWGDCVGVAVVQKLSVKYIGPLNDETEDGRVDQMADQELGLTSQTESKDWSMRYTSDVAEQVSNV